MENAVCNYMSAKVSRCLCNHKVTLEISNMNNPLKKSKDNVSDKKSKYCNPIFTYLIYLMLYLRRNYINIQICFFT